ncbi:uncharacterized protein LOC119185533 [Rhipicephalus microplus]|uniref:uncharacterized protein LOC119185533 n=1 Tax=Rhipicephalus microplus TaxID=6941 RepID=UPI003F6B31B5
MSGLYHFLYMPFGIKTAPAVFARLMRSVLGGVDNVHHYFDDVIIATDTWQEHIDTLRQVFERINQAHLTIKPSKCEIGERSISFLGHRIGETTVEPLLKTLDKILAAKRPTTKKAVQSFLGLTGYYRKFIPNYAELTKPLTDLTRKGQSHTVSWGAHQEEAFTALKKKLGDAPILLAPDLSKEFVLRTDASNTSLGAVLLQMGKGQVLHPVAYASRPTVDWGATTTEQAGTQIRLVEGVPVAGFCEDWAVRAALRHEPRDDEVYVVAYPKSGTTWVHYLTRRLLHQGHESPAESAMQCMLSSIIGYTGSDKPGAVIKSHLLFGRTPFSEKARYVYVLRNPYDCCVSYYHQRAGLPNLPAISFDEFLDDFIEGQVPFGDYFDHLAAWFPERSRPNVICVPYEQLKGDVRAGILRIADFLGRDIGHALRNDDGALQGIIQTTSPDEMRRHFSEARAALLTAPSDEKQAQVAAAFRARGHRAPPAGAGDGEKANLYKLVRKATVGDCRNHFSDAQAQRMKANMDSKMASKMAVHREAVLVLWKSVNLP